MSYSEYYIHRSETENRYQEYGGKFQKGEDNRYQEYGDLKMGGTGSQFASQPAPVNLEEFEALHKSATEVTEAPETPVAETSVEGPEAPVEELVAEQPVETEQPVEATAEPVTTAEPVEKLKKRSKKKNEEV